METAELDPRLRRMEQARMKDRVVLVRVDHNVVKSGRIKDPYRIESTFGTLYAIAEKGGRPILMTHVGRPRDKKTGKIECRPAESVAPIVRYLEERLAVRIHVPDFPVDPDRGILHLDDAIHGAVDRLRSGEIGMIYLPNCRWFHGEQGTAEERSRLAGELAGLADLYVNDAFGSYRAHASTFDVAGRLPSFAGVLMQKELSNLHRVLEPERPFVAVVAGAKYDTKIGPLMALHDRVDHLILGGLLYNTYLSARYGIRIAGVSGEDRDLAMELVERDRKERKILELPYLVESDVFGERTDGRYRRVSIDDFRHGGTLEYIVDVDPASLETPRVKEILGSAGTIFVNAVMGLMPHFYEGSRALYARIAGNTAARKLFGGGDTLQELKNLCPGIYLSGLDAPETYYFTGGGSVLAAIEQGSPYGLKPVAALMESG